VASPCELLAQYLPGTGDRRPFPVARAVKRKMHRSSAPPGSAGVARAGCRWPAGEDPLRRGYHPNL